MSLNKMVIASMCVISLFFTSACSSQSNNDLDMDDIIGKWTIQKKDLISDPYLLSPADTMDLITLFGAELWSHAVGKYFEFKENGVLETDFLINDPSLSPEMAEFSEMSKKTEFAYKFDPGLKITFNYDKDFYAESPVKIVMLESNKMIWDIAGLYNITLLKAE